MKEEGNTLLLLASAALQMTDPVNDDNNAIFERHNITVRRMEKRNRKPIISESVHPTSEELPNVYSLSCAQRFLSKLTLFKSNLLKLHYENGRTANFNVAIEYISTDGWFQLSCYNSTYMYAFVISVVFDKNNNNEQKQSNVAQGHRFVTFLPSEALAILKKLGLVNENLEVDDNRDTSFDVPLNAIRSIHFRK